MGRGGKRVAQWKERWKEKLEWVLSSESDINRMPDREVVGESSEKKGRKVESDFSGREKKGAKSLGTARSA